MTVQTPAARMKRSRIFVTVLSLLGVAGVVILAGKLLHDADRSNELTLPPALLPTDTSLESQPAFVSRPTTGEAVPPPATPEARLPPQAYCKQGYTLLHKERRIADAISTFET